MSIRVTAELLRYGSGEPEAIGVLEIGNRSIAGEVCDYDYRFGEVTRDDGSLGFGPWNVVRGHDRRRGVWTLVGQILARRAAGDEEPSDYTGD